MLQTVGNHTPESHAFDNVKRGFTLAQSGAIEGLVHANPMASCTEVRRTLNLQGLLDAVYISPSKRRAVQRAISEKGCHEGLLTSQYIPYPLFVHIV